MKYNGASTRKNAQVIGLCQTYEAWEFKTSTFQKLSGKGMICIFSRVALPKKYRLLCIKYCEDIQDFLKQAETISPIVYSCFFISCSGSQNAEAIITDIIELHSFLERF